MDWKRREVEHFNAEFFLQGSISGDGWPIAVPEVRAGKGVERGIDMASLWFTLESWERKGPVVDANLLKKCYRSTVSLPAAME